MSKIKVLIVDDSALIRRIVKDLLETDATIDVVGTVKNGKEALEFIQRTPVDVITLDVEMPVMDGISTLREIMNTNPIPVVMLSSLTKKGADMTFKALDLGAIDFVEKPSNVFSIQSSEVDNDIREKVKNAAKAKLRKNSVNRMDFVKPRRKFADLSPLTQRSTDSEDVKEIIAIGTSTGGPKALHEVIGHLSARIVAPVLVVQHMPKGFTKSLADRLNSISALRVKEAEDNEPLMNGTVYIAPGDRHLKIVSVAKNRYRIRLDDGENVSGHKPSVDAMFYSLSEESSGRVMAVVMTGMGADGAKGIERLKEKKQSYNVAEDESTCVVFGMPKSAIATGKIDKIVPLNKIADEINKRMGV